jgi:hypothetical protein
LYVDTSQRKDPVQAGDMLRLLQSSLMFKKAPKPLDFIQIILSADNLDAGTDANSIIKKLRVLEGKSKDKKFIYSFHEVLSGKTQDHAFVKGRTLEQLKNAGDAEVGLIYCGREALAETLGGVADWYLGMLSNEVHTK